MDTLNKAFQLYLQGYSLRNLSKRFNIPKSTLSYQFKKAFGLDYTNLRNSYGAIQVIKEYIHNPDISTKDKHDIKRWLSNNLSTILESETANIKTPLYSDRYLDRLTFKECSHRSKDWKQLFEVILKA
ncbi:MULTISPECIES: helix-turn-helix domain-containing protein [unclassified Anabaena]|uniref:helix-turn-helix domain-containing protein n=1 Tax=unclassified Anabaena TaxID=2619674 RepID=UPI0006AC72B8|nr:MULTISPECIES: helix-turn-helix domain-containing protein [unclassified Anabaena]ALB39893.1 hypothetical protein AA650_04925 [Anabaena sp. WA102]OBQ17634.1 MAG: hypothetical protein AN486_14535 [Anabaena sp. AL93]